MTKPSSSLFKLPSDLPLVVDSAGKIVPLGELLGSGGEGRVFAVRGAVGMAAKLYHQTPLSDEQAHKLQAMAGMSTTDLAAVAAWPRDVLFDASTRAPRGIVMPRIAQSRQLHELYGTTNRGKHFPEAQWGHLVLAARNAAAAFHTIHSKGIVVGDVNQGNLLVNHDMCVQFIDCDSFQVQGGRRTFRCPVGTPHFTPPELQSVRLADVTRTPDHDAFGLAILIFHLLFVGRHPFAGRFRGQGDLSIERAIAERRFAFSHDRNGTQVDPPPASLTLDDLPPTLGAMFEQAFRQGASHKGPRPEPGKWVTELERLLKLRKTCTVDQTHSYFSGLMHCPWCRIEDVGGPSFFLNVALGAGTTEDRLVAFEEQIKRMDAARFPELPAARLAAPALDPPRGPAQPAPRSAADALAATLAVSAVACIAGGFYWPVLVAAAVGALGAGAGLVWGAAGKQRRARLAELDAALDAATLKSAHAADQVEAAHAKRHEEFETYAAVVRAGLNRFYADTESVDAILAQLREEQKEDFLRGFLVRDFRRKIPGLSPATVVQLESYGLETAFDVEKELLASIPSIDEHLRLELLLWRESIEGQFVFKSEDGVTHRELHASRQEATRRFKISQARKVLTGGKRLRSMAYAAEGRLGTELASYERVADEWRRVAERRRDFQASRRPLERMLNAGPVETLTIAIAAPALGALIAVFFGGWLG